MNGTLTPLQRFFLAFIAFFAVLFNRRFAEEVSLLRARQRGIAAPDQVFDYEAVFGEADAALYEAKHSGRNRVCPPPAGTPAIAA